MEKRTTLYVFLGLLLVLGIGFLLPVQDDGAPKGKPVTMAEAAPEPSPVPQPSPASEERPDAATRPAPPALPELEEFGVHGIVYLMSRTPGSEPTPAAGAEILIRPTEERDGEFVTTTPIKLSSGEDGTFLQPLPDLGAVYFLQVMYPGHGARGRLVVGPEYEGSVLQDQDWANDWKHPRAIHLFPETPYAGRVVYTDGAPASNIRLTAYQAMPEPTGAWGRTSVQTVEAYSDAEGGFSLHGIATYGVYLTAHKEGTFLKAWEGIQSGDSILLEVPREDRPRITVTGIVYDHGDRLGLEGAEVRLLDWRPSPGHALASSRMRFHELEEWTVRTGAGGRFRIEGIPRGMYRLGLQASGHVLREAHPANLFETNTGPEALLDLTAVAEPDVDLALHAFPGYTIIGQTVHFATGNPLPGVKLSTETLGNPLFQAPGSELEIVSNEHGRFDLEGFIQSESIEIEVVSTEYETFGARYRTDRATQRRHRMVVEFGAGSLEREMIIQLRPLYSASGRVVTPEGDPVPNAEVSATLDRQRPSGGGSSVGAPWRPVEPDGSFESIAPELGGVQFRARRGPEQVAASEQFEIDGAGVEGIEIVLGTAGSIEGRVIFPAGYSADETGAHAPVPVFGEQRPASATLWPEPYPSKGPIATCVLAADGSFRFDHVNPGGYQITVAHPSLPLIGPAGLHLEDGEELTGFTIRAEGESIDLLVEDPEGSPLAGVHVTIRISGAPHLPMGQQWNISSLETPEDGRIRLAGIQGAEYLVQLSAPGSFHRLESDRFPLDGEPRVFVYRMNGKEEEEAGPMTVYLFDATSGDPVPADRYRVRRVDGWSGSARVEAHDGYFVDRTEGGGRNFGRYLVESETYAPKEIRIGRFREGEAREAVELLYRGSRVTGRVVAPNSTTRVRDLRVQAIVLLANGNRGTELDSTFTAADGRFEFERLSPGPTSIFVLPAGDSTLVRTTVTIPEESDRIDVGDIEIGPGGTVEFRLSGLDQDILASSAHLIRVALSGEYSPPGAIVPDSRNFGSGALDQAGIVSFDAIPPGEYSLRVSIPVDILDYESQEGAPTSNRWVGSPRIPIDHGGQTTVSFELLPGPHRRGSQLGTWVVN